MGGLPLERNAARLRDTNTWRLTDAVASNPNGTKAAPSWLRYPLRAISATLGWIWYSRPTGTRYSVIVPLPARTLNRSSSAPYAYGRLLISERPGRLRVFANGRLDRTPLAGAPQVYARGQAGLLDICLHPAFAQNRLLYLSYISDGPGGPVTAAARAELGEGGLRGLTPFFEALPRRPGSLNLGSRLRFDRAGFVPERAHRVCAA